MRNFKKRYTKWKKTLGIAKWISSFEEIKNNIDNNNNNNVKLENIKTKEISKNKENDWIYFKWNNFINRK